MDIICPRCAEPYDVLDLRDTFTPEERDDFRSGRGCSRSCRTNPPAPRSMRTALATAALELAGGDLEAAAGDLDSFGVVA